MDQKDIARMAEEKALEAYEDLTYAATPSNKEPEKEPEPEPEPEEEEVGEDED